MEYHNPVLLNESVESLINRPDGTYIDVTFGGGGHSRLILEKLGADGALFGFDQDSDVLENVPDDNRFTFVQGNFRFLKRFLRLHTVNKVDGLLADLGVSSHQFDAPERGFSFRYDAELDMRMSPGMTKTAATVLRSYSAEDLQRIFSDYGEVRNAKTLAKHIVTQREHRAVKTTLEFVALMEPFIRGNRNRYLAQVFQALRIEVNEEMEALKTLLEDTLEMLKPGGRMVVISYHSLEDRLVKNFFKTGNFKGEHEADFYGNIKRPFKLITKKALLPSAQEIKVNPRARSAKLRVAEKK